MIKTTKDGRTIRTHEDYSHFRWQLYQGQCGACSNCSRVTHILHDPLCNDSFHVHHKNGRGMGGGKRDDTLEACTGLCGRCHRKEHGQ